MGSEKWREVIEGYDKLVKCHKCPLWGLCPNEQYEMSYRLQFLAERTITPVRGVDLPFQHDIDEFQHKKGVLTITTKLCHLMRGMSDDRKCKECNGRGEVTIPDEKHPGAVTDVRCEVCGGRGYIEEER